MACQRATHVPILRQATRRVLEYVTRGIALSVEHANANHRSEENIGCFLICGLSTEFPIYNEISINRQFSLFFLTDVLSST